MTCTAKRTLVPAEQAPKRRLRIGKKLSAAIDAIVFDGADLQSAAKAAENNSRDNQLMPDRPLQFSAWCSTSGPGHSRRFRHVCSMSGSRVISEISSVLIAPA